MHSLTSKRPALQIYVDDPSVLFVSTHQSGAYPGTGRMSEVGKGDGEGATINLPLPGTPLRASCLLLPGFRTA